MITTVFFDLYGTLAGFNPSRFEIQSAACEPFGITLTPEGVLRGYALADTFMSDENAAFPVRSRGPASTKRFFAEYERLVLQGAGVDVDAGRAWEVWENVRQQRYEMTLFNDVLPVFDLLKQQGLTLGMISNMNRPAGELAASMGLARYLDFAVTSGEAGVEKPHPAIFRMALERAGSEPQETVHVGDQLMSDVDGASAVGISPILLDRDGNHPGYDGCPRITTLMELPALVGLM